MQSEQFSFEGRLLSLSEVRERFPLSKSTIYRGIARGTFPKPIRISAGRVAWSEHELIGWLKSRRGA
jgi:prophage regulatory protein